MKKVRGRRLGVCGKPVTHWFMQLLDLFLRDLGQAASKPLARESEADCLHSSWHSRQQRQNSPSGLHSRRRAIS
jgi:hypothetical protein